MQLIAWHGTLQEAERAKRKNNIHNKKKIVGSKEQCLFYL